MNAPSASCNRQTIEQFLADQLTDEEQTTFENHLECCPSCRQCALAAWLYIRNRRTSDAPNRANDKEVKDQSQVALVTFSCSGCGKHLKTKTGTASKKVKCPHCGQAVSVPAPDPITAP